MAPTSSPPEHGPRRQRISWRLCTALAVLIVVTTATLVSHETARASTLRDAAACEQPSQPSTTPSSLTALLDGTPPQADAQRAAIATDTVAAVDLSGSTFGPNGTDPTGERFRAVHALIGLISSLRDGLADRFGIILFGSDAPPDASTGLTLLPSGTSLLYAKLQQPINMGNTNFAAAIRRAATSLQTTSPGRARNLVIVTDGMPDLGDGRPPQALIPDISAALHELPADVHTHLLIVGDDSTWNQAQALWGGLGLASIGRLTTTSDLLAEYLDVLRPDLGLERLYAGPVPANRSLSIAVPPLTDRLALTVLSLQPDPSSALTSPAGQRQGVRRSDNGVSLLTTINPTPGAWTATGLPPGLVVVERSPLQIRVQHLAATVPMGRALQPELTLQTAQGYRPAQLPPSLPDHISASITAPNGNQTAVNFHLSGPGHWAISHSIPTPATGRYTLTLQPGTQASRPAPTIRYVVTPQPYADTQQPRNHLDAGSPVTIAATLRFGRSRWDATPGTQIEAELRTDSGRILEQIPLRTLPDGSDVRGQFMTSAQAGCAYELRVVMHTPSGTSDTWISPTLHSS